MLPPSALAAGTEGGVPGLWWKPSEEWQVETVQNKMQQRASENPRGDLPVADFLRYHVPSQNA